MAQKFAQPVDAGRFHFEIGDAVLTEIEQYKVQFCEQPMRHWEDAKLPELLRLSPVKIMADESVFDHHDARRLLEAGACDYVNIKFSKSGGLLEAAKISEDCKAYSIPCMMGGMLESRIALSAAAHFVLAHPNIVFYDMDTSLIGHKKDPVKGGLQYKGYVATVPDTPGIGADAADEFLNQLEQVVI